MLKLLLQVLSALLLLIQRKHTKEEQTDAQAEADAVNSDPTGWFQSHFGVRKPNSTSETPSSQASADERNNDK